MTSQRTHINWPSGTLRACESAVSIAVKLAIFNRTGALAYEAEVRGCGPASLSRLLQEPLQRVRAVIEQPAWVGEMDALIEQSIILREDKWDAQRVTAHYNHKYCPQCLESFYHSWIHDLSWMDHCFVHRGTELVVVPPASRAPQSRAVADKLYAAWTPALQNHIRSAETSRALFDRLSNRKLLHAAKALGALFEPSRLGETSRGAFACNPIALNSWWKAIEQRNGIPAIPWRKPGVHAQQTRDGGQQAFASIAGTWGTVLDNAHELLRAHPASAPEEGTAAGQGYARAEVSIVTQAQARTRAALASGLVSAIRRSTDNWLTQSHDQHRHLRFVGQARFASRSAAPDFQTHLAHVLATGTRGRERLLLKDLIARLSHGHERCLEDLRKRYERWEHLAMTGNCFTDADYIAYGLGTHGVCARLVTLDLVTRMLRPHFLCAGHRREVVERRSRPGPDAWQHAALRHQDLFGSHEWNPYKWTYQATQVLPQDAEVQHFARTLHTIEWAFFRCESLGHESKPIDVALKDILSDQQMVVVTAEGVEENFLGRELLYMYFSTDDADAPDWAALGCGRPTACESEIART